MGAMADDVKSSAAEAGREALDRGKHVVEEAGSAALDAAKESGREEGEELTATLQEKAREVLPADERRPSRSEPSSASTSR